MYRPASFAALLACLVLLGCGGGEDKTDKEKKEPEKKTVAAKPVTKYKPVTLDLGPPTKGQTPKEKTYTTEDVRKALNPLQVMVGTWEGTLQRKKAFDSLNWRWDFSNRGQPALYFESDEGLVVKSGSLTYLPADRSFKMEAVDADDETRTLMGNFEVEPHKVAGDDNRLHMNYKLLLEEETPPEGEKPWQVTFNQQDNNRLLVELEEKRGSMFVRFETMGIQREGTSFARSFDDYGDRTCIVSQGLGVSTVSFEGMTYYVCCSGCESAFNDDPEFWIAKAMERANEE